MARKEDCTKKVPKKEVIPVAPLANTGIYVRTRGGDPNNSSHLAILHTSNVPDAYINTFCQVCESRSSQSPLSANLNGNGKPNVPSGQYDKAKICQPQTVNAPRRCVSAFNKKS